MLFVVPPGEPKNAHVMPYQEALPEGGSVLRTRRLDATPEWADIEFAKIDVEGAEQLVWAGAQGLLDGGRLKTVVLEFAGARYADPAGFVDRIIAHGFSLSYVDLREGVRPITREGILAHDPQEDILLYLER